MRGELGCQVASTKNVIIIGILLKKFVNIDGDFACCPKCAEEYRKQRDYFFTVVIHDDDKYNQWMEGET